MGQTMCVRLMTMGIQTLDRFQGTSGYDTTLGEIAQCCFCPTVDPAAPDIVVAAEREEGEMQIR